MRAIVYERYGSPEIRELDPPVPGENEVLVRVHASSVNVADWIFMSGKPWVIRFATGLFRPRNRILGGDLAGRVEAVGKAVTRFRPGDEVFGDIGFGAYAEYACASESRIALKPSSLSFEQAAALPIAGITALQGLRDHGGVRSGQSVVINGASGAVGTFAVQIAKAFGAEVTGVCSTRNLDMVRSIGADHVSDYTQEDFTQSGKRYNFIFDLAGSRPLSACKSSLTPDGLYVSSAGQISWVLKVAVASLFAKQIKVMPAATVNPEDLATLGELCESGKVTPVIDRTYGLSEVPDALRRQGEGHAQGKTVIRV